MAEFIRQGVPSWFRFNQASTMYQFEKLNSGWPRDWTPAAGKYNIFEGEGDAFQQDFPTADARGIKNPLLRTGVTHISVGQFTHGGQSLFSSHPEVMARTLADLGVVGPANMNGACDETQWNAKNWADETGNNAITIMDFENFCVERWGWPSTAANEAKFTKFKEIVAAVKARIARDNLPNRLIGCWGVGPVHMPPVYSMDAQGNVDVASGTLSQNGALNWKTPYLNPQKYRSRVFLDAGLTFGNRSIYKHGCSRSTFLEQVLHTEIGRLVVPDTPNVLSNWITEENGQPNFCIPFQAIRWTAPGGARNTNLRMSPPQFHVYTTSLYAFIVGDGLSHWGVGNNLSTNPAHDGSVEVTINGVVRKPWYALAHHGGYDWHQLAAWFSNQHRDIIEAGGIRRGWLLPEYKTSTLNQWRTGDYRYPVVSSFLNEPIVRIKYSARFDEALVFAVNPKLNGTVQTVTVRDPQAGWDTSFKLVGPWPALGRVKIPIAT